MKVFERIAKLDDRLADIKARFEKLGPLTAGQEQTMQVAFDQVEGDGTEKNPWGLYEIEAALEEFGV